MIKSKINRCIAVIIVLAMAISMLSMSALAAEGDIAIEKNNYLFEKITNPTAGSGEADGINTNDPAYPANRFNSYAWAVASRGDYIYIGTNRNLFGSAMNTAAKNSGIDVATASELVTTLSGGAVPSAIEMDAEDYIPQIIRLNSATGETKVIYQPDLGELDPKSEVASFRSVVSFNGNLYYGSLGVNRVQIVRVDEDDNATVVYSAVTNASSFRAGTVYNNGSGETIYFGGQDSLYDYWLQNGKAQGYIPIVIRGMDPNDDTNWDTIIADYTDFAAYAKDTVYSSAGGTVWDLISFNGKLYMILATDNGFALFRGEHSGLSADGANKFGWTWTEIVGDNGSYPLGMDRSLAEGVNAQYPGLVASTATPYIYDGKMYIGTFDNATLVQSSTILKILTRLNYIKSGDLTSGPKLSAIYGPIYETLSRPQKIYAMDANEKITEITEASNLLKGTNNEYVWRFQEHNGNLYAGTFDATSAYTYYVNMPPADLFGIEDPADNYILKMLEYIIGIPTYTATADNKLKTATKSETGSLLTNTRDTTEDYFNGTKSLDEFVDSLTELEEFAATAEVPTNTTEELVTYTNTKQTSYIEQIKELLDMIDLDGLKMMLKARDLVNKAHAGFDLIVTADGENWEMIADDGFGDEYNYGARTFTVCNDDLYLGTANPYYGAQVWQITAQTPDNTEAVAAAKATVSGASYNVKQAKANTEAAVKRAIEKKLDALNLGGVSASVTMNTFTAAVAGTSGNPEGVNGSFTATVTLSKGTGNTLVTDTVNISGIIIATQYVKHYPTAQPATPYTEPTATTTTTTRPEKEVKLTRLSGDTRIDTAIAISRQGWSSSSTVVLANGYDFPDALVGAPLANALDAPMLLSSGNALESYVLTEIKRLGATRVYILGGTEAISSELQTSLEANGLSVKRLAGADRFGTAIAIATELRSITGKAFTELYFTNAYSFADALSISSVAAIQGNPILYIPSTGAIDAATAAYAKSTGCTNATILGGTAAVSDAGEQSIKALGLNTTRISGADRYDTAQMIYTKYNAVFAGKDYVVATGKAFPDALAGTAYAAKLGIPVILVGDTVNDSTRSYIQSRDAGNVYIFGGTSAVPDAVVNALIK